MIRMHSHPDLNKTSRWAKSQSKEKKAHCNNHEKCRVFDFQMQTRLESTELRVQEIGRSKTTRALTDHVKKFIFNPKSNGKPLKRLNEMRSTCFYS